MVAASFSTFPLTWHRINIERCLIVQMVQFRGSRNNEWRCSELAWFKLTHEVCKGPASKARYWEEPFELMRWVHPGLDHELYLFIYFIYMDNNFIWSSLVIENTKRKKCPASTINEFELNDNPWLSIIGRCVLTSC